MKGLKKFITGILAGAMAFSITFTAGSAMTANAADITITRDSSATQTGVDEAAVEAQTYTVYKILSAEKADNNEYTYYVTDTNQKAVLEQIGFTFSQVSVNGETRYLANFTGTDGDALAKAIQEKLSTNAFTAVATNVPATAGATKIPVGDDGYYLIISSVGTKLIANTFVDGGTVKEKNVYPTLDKKQRKENVGDYSDDKLVVKVGDIIEYSIDVTVPYNTSEDIIVLDKMSSGLELVGTPEVSGISTSYEEYAVEGYSFGFKFAKTTSTEPASQAGKITFKARVTKDAIVDTGRKNEAELRYGNYITKDEVPYGLKKTGAHKYDGVTNANLAGAEFTLEMVNGEEVTEIKVVKHDNGVYYPSDEADASSTVVSDANGLIIIRGLEDGKNYQLRETKAPEGYNLPAGDDAVFNLDLEDDTLGTDGSVSNPANLREIANYSGATLPSTGGIGTTIFYIIGGLLIVAAVVFFVVRRKADAE
ncbi:MULTISPECIES: SpaA isopeptide-forming pilin-related protein [unclassified Butyrivibrio]|uniref:SpaA isopeptide-forming pilin-related protein n=1 Tax=unclassified Butyrivibrio TaxID=2639466 RepID=UPI0003B54871|nr:MULTISPECIES: SpaA isopeptide-forming pilin-related protein [unclassified Butyrivibrio]SEL10403.1 LPXTG-motif cell wall anchor domain-containing protein/fimbrial isopeptide formation D2 domain-containing protein [Butyrivibrio sp. ob235]